MAKILGNQWIEVMVYIRALNVLPHKHHIRPVTTKNSGRSFLLNCHRELVTTIEEMDSKYGRINYYISPKRLYEDTGYVWKGEKTVNELDQCSASA